MLKKTLLTAAFVVAGLVAAVPAQASPGILRADLGKNNGATLDVRFDRHGVRSHVRIGGLSAGVYTYSTVATWSTKGGDVVIITKVCGDTLKAGQTTFECGAENINPYAGMPAGSSLKMLEARVTRQGAAGAVANGRFF